jgi:hypothetical protein
LRIGRKSIADPYFERTYSMTDNSPNDFTCYAVHPGAPNDKENLKDLVMAASKDKTVPGILADPNISGGPETGSRAKEKPGNTETVEISVTCSAGHENTFEITRRKEG